MVFELTISFDTLYSELTFPLLKYFFSTILQLMLLRCHMTNTFVTATSMHMCYSHLYESLMSRTRSRMSWGPLQAMVLPMWLPATCSWHSLEMHLTWSPWRSWDKFHEGGSQIPMISSWIHSRRRECKNSSKLALLDVLGSGELNV